MDHVRDRDDQGRGHWGGWGPARHQGHETDEEDDRRDSGLLPPSPRGALPRDLPRGTGDNRQRGGQKKGTFSSHTSSSKTRTGGRGGQSNVSVQHRTTRLNATGLYSVARTDYIASGHQEAIFFNGAVKTGVVRNNFEFFGIVYILSVHSLWCLAMCLYLKCCRQRMGSSEGYKLLATRSCCCMRSTHADFPITRISLYLDLYSLGT